MNPASEICLQSGIPRSTFYTWLKPYKAVPTKSKFTINGTEFLRLKNQMHKLQQEIEVLQTVNCTASAPLKSKLQELILLHGQYSVHVLCEALKVDRGTYYNHLLRNKKDANSYQLRRAKLSEQIRKVYDESNQIYGAKKIKAVFASRGVATSNKMIAELMDEMNLASIRTEAKKNSVKLTSKKKKDALKMNFSAKGPNKVWVSDVTSFKLHGKFYYICVIIDLYSRKVLACKISKKHSTQLITATFKMAYSQRKPAGNLSFSPPGSPRNNAVMESFFASMKKEELYRTHYRSEKEFKECLKSYIHFYNNERPHATLDYKTLNHYEYLYLKEHGSQKN